ncbi:AzlC family ABC transporter permease [Umezawaea endophytica]|uniref:AzlC family ABC transporter permease n=1 Tax=Umezawaea endophytica TaxID=1654476 RepID=A0A9X2VLB0_9PSEU|nr:AzlC family ABC transporter permease [Umezawaea endophytica]MCS7478617.1 AzlC family ABC transporter permease [Umezawaea endophytica]
MHHLRLAVHDTRSVSFAYLALGATLGVLVVHSGLEWWWATVFTALVYAGSLEFLLVGLVVAAVPLATVALTAFLVNLRHVFYAVSFPLHRIRGAAGKALGTFGLTDEAFALVTAKPPNEWTGPRILWLQGFCQLYWVSGATAGALLGSLVPSSIAGLEFTLTALFVVLALDAHRTRRDVPTAVIAALSAVVALLLFHERMLLVAMALFTAGLLARRAVSSRRTVDA